MNVVLLLLGVVIGAVYCILYFANADKYTQIIDAVDDDVIAIKDVIVVGLAIIQKFNIQTGKADIKKRQKLAELFTSQYVDFYCLVIYAANISYALVFIPLGCLLGALTNSILLGILVCLMAAFMPYFTSSRINSQLKTRREELLLDYPTVLSKMALMINAGMMLRDAWKIVADSGTRKLYQEMKRTAVNIANGASEIDAYSEFGTACKINELKKFSSIICQNVEKGNSELVQVMKQLSVEAWNTKKNIAISRGKNAETKLLIPVGITFVAIIIMIMVPIMSNVGF